MSVFQLEHEGRTDAKAPATLDRRALALWPRLDPAALRRCRHDPRRIAVLVSRRTAMPLDAIFQVLTMPAVQDDEIETWFG
jgi:hypothetical protein